MNNHLLDSYNETIFYRKRPHTTGMPENMCKVGYNGKWLYLLDKHDEPLPGQVSMTLKDRVNAIPEATVEVMVDLREIVKINDRA